MSKLLKKDRNKLSFLYYEVQMFRCMYKYLEEDGKLPRGLQNAILESFLVHVRNLIDFLSGTDDNKPSHKKNCSDIIISDFKDQDGNNLHLVEKEDWKITLQDKQKINKRLSHLSEERLIEDKSWEEEIEKFKEEINKQIKKFLGGISDEYFPFKKDNKEIIKENFGICGEEFCRRIQKIDDETTVSSDRALSITDTCSSC